MNFLMKSNCFATNYVGLAYRHLSCSSTLCLKRHREQMGLPINKNAEGVLTDAPDYTFLDGRPTPLLVKQKQRLLKQRNFASQIVELNGELDFAIEREKALIKSKEDERQKILGNKLKPKGYKLLQKK